MNEGNKLNDLNNLAASLGGSRIASKAYSNLALEPDQYRADLEEFNMTQEQENELLQVLWNMMSTMVEIGWGVDTVQIILPELFDKAGQDSDKLLEDKHLNYFNQTANSKKETKDE